MLTTLPFDEHVAEYEAWFKKYPFVFQSELDAIRHFLPVGETVRGLEIALGTGQFAQALGIKEGIEPAPHMRAVAVERGIDVLAADAAHLPYKDLSFDFALMAFCISYFEDVLAAFTEAKRIVKINGSLVVGFIDKDSIIGKEYQARKSHSLFYRQANFYSTKRVHALLKEAGFKKFEFAQTLFHKLDEVQSVEAVRPGYGEGSFVVIKATH